CAAVRVLAFHVHRAAHTTELAPPDSVLVVGFAFGGALVAHRASGAQRQGFTCPCQVVRVVPPFGRKEPCGRACARRVVSPVAHVARLPGASGNWHPSHGRARSPFFGGVLRTAHTSASVR